MAKRDLTGGKVFGPGGVVYEEDDDIPSPDAELDEALGLEREAYEYGKDAYEKDRDELDALIAEGKADIDAAGAEATTAEDALAHLMGVQLIHHGKPITAGEYEGDYESVGAKAAADPESIAAQKEVLSELGRRAEGGLTPVEELMLEMNRRKQERDLRGQREAMMRGMQARGIASSGLEVAGVMGAQQESAERRMLEDMAAAGLAQERADRALVDRGSLATDIRTGSFDEEFKTGTQADEVAKHNRTLKLDYDRHRTETEMEDAERRWRNLESYVDTRGGQVKDQYERAGDPARFHAGVAVPTSEKRPEPSGITDVLKAKYGAMHADKAADSLTPDEDDGILGWVTNPTSKIAGLFDI